MSLKTQFMALLFCRLPKHGQTKTLAQTEGKCIVGKSRQLQLQPKVSQFVGSPTHLIQSGIGWGQVLHCVATWSTTIHLYYRLTDQSTDWPIDRLTNRPTDQSTDWPIDRLTNRPTDQSTTSATSASQWASCIRIVVVVVSGMQL